MKDETEWFRVVAWEKLAETCNEFLRKGSKVYIEGRLQTREWQDQQGQNQKMVEVVANEMVLLDSRQQGGGGGGYSDEPRQPASRPGSNNSNTSNNSSGFDDDDMDVDDIPF